MIYLPNGCKCSDISVFPKNWNTKKASIKKDWRIWYRFYDPLFKDRWPKGKPVVIKSGINKLKTLSDRQEFAANQIIIEKDLLINEGYNHITGRYNKPVNIETDISPSTLFLPALEKALKLRNYEKQTRMDMQSMLRYFTAATNKTGLQYKFISEIRLKHIKAIFMQLAIDKVKWNASRYNRYRQYLLSIFDELLENEAVDHNPVSRMKKMVQEKKIRQTLDEVQRRQVDLYLRQKKMMRLRLFVRIFFHSGARITELLSVKGKDVNLQHQYFIVTIKKGNRKIQVKKTIRNCALRYWKLAMSGCEADMFVFSKGLKPGAADFPIHHKQLSRRWRIQVKQALGFQADLYSLKHANSTETSDKYGGVVAAAQNSHEGTGMVINIYDTKYSERNHRELKKVVVDF